MLVQMRGVEVEINSRTNESAIIVFRPAAMAGSDVGKGCFQYGCVAFGMLVYACRTKKFRGIRM